jgi:thiamine pyrophosphate-dependent acetolactate synthase large subunit-like protein
VAERLLTTLDTPAPRPWPLHAPEVLATIARPEHVAAQALRGDRRPIDLIGLMRRLDERLPANRLVAVDSGHTTTFPAQYLDVPPDRGLCITSHFGAIGLGLGTGMGAACARPDAQTVVFVGDGALAMVLGDLETVARHAEPLLVVVLNDQAYGAERHFMDLLGIDSRHARHPDIDFAGVARSLGIDAFSVDSLEQLDAVPLDGSLRTPLLIDCKVDPEQRAAWLTEFL